MEEDETENLGPSGEYLAWLNQPFTQELLRWAKRKHEVCRDQMVTSASNASDMSGVAKTRLFAGGYKFSEAFIARMEKGK